LKNARNPLTKPLKMDYIQQYKKKPTKAMTKRSTHYPLKERVAACALKGCLKEGMRKVASEPEDPEQQVVLQLCRMKVSRKPSRFIPVIG